MGLFPLNKGQKTLKKVSNIDFCTWHELSKRKATQFHKKSYNICADMICQFLTHLWNLPTTQIEGRCDPKINFPFMSNLGDILGYPGKWESPSSITSIPWIEQKVNSIPIAKLVQFSP